VGLTLFLGRLVLGGILIAVLFSRNDQLIDRACSLLSSGFRYYRLALFQSKQ
jgi:hypothetical protein